MFYNIQFLRAFAAFGVVLVHTLQAADKYGRPADFLSHLGDFGGSGVDIFFVISGFVMVVSQSGNPKSASQFIANRLVRIAPTYWLLTLAFIGLYLLLPQAFSTVTITPERAVKSFLFSSRLMGEVNPVLYVGWTLEFEMLFYSVFALAIFMGGGRVNYFVLMGIITLIAVLFSQWILFEFLAGVLVGLFYKTGLPRWALYCTFLLGSALLAATIAFPPDETYRAIFWGFPATLIVFSLAGIPQITNRFARLLGDASYSIYLLHIFTISALYKVAPQINGDLLVVACSGVAVGAGVIFYVLIEMPMTNRLRRMRTRPTGRKPVPSLEPVTG